MPDTSASLWPVPARRRLAGWLGLLAFAIGQLAFAGTVLDLPLLARWLPDLPGMKVNTALGLSLLAMVLVQRAWDADRQLQRIASVSAGLVATLGAATLLEWLVSIDLGIDQGLMTEQPQPGFVAGRMAVPTAIAFVLLGLAALLLKPSPRRVRLVQALALVGGFPAVCLLYAFLFGELQIFRNPVTGVALPTCVALTALATGLAVTHPELGWAGVQKGSTGAWLIRRQLPWALLLPPLATGLVHVADLRGALPDHLSLTFLTVAYVLLFAVTAVWSARLIDRLERDRAVAEKAAVGLREDLVARERTEAALRDAKLAAEQANLAKSRFLANVSHEIRTPMNAILGMAEVLALTPLTEKQALYVQTFRNAGQSLLAILDDVLDLSKVEAGHMTFAPVELDLGQLARDLTAFLRPRARARGLALTCHVDPGLPGLVLGDPHRLRQVMTNLLNNAIKFTEAGQVTLEIEPAGPDRVRVVVRDTGIGIPADKLAMVFEDFTQVDPSATRERGGVGLGLAIVRRLVERMDGQVEVDSVLGKGSEFRCLLHLPTVAGTARPQALQPASALPQPQDLGPLRVLLVDDAPDNRLLVKAFLEPLGWRIDEAVDGAEAVERWDALAPDVVLMDVQMPRVDGYTATRAIRDRERTGGRPATPIIALTAHAMSADAEESRAAGCTSHLAKPVRRDSLTSAIVLAVRGLTDHNVH